MPKSNVSLNQSTVSETYKWNKDTNYLKANYNILLYKISITFKKYNQSFLTVSKHISCKKRCPSISSSDVMLCVWIAPPPTHKNPLISDLVITDLEKQKAENPMFHYVSRERLFIRICCLFYKLRTVVFFLVKNTISLAAFWPSVLFVIEAKPNKLFSVSITYSI